METDPDFSWLYAGVGRVMPYEHFLTDGEGFVIGCKCNNDD